MPYNPRQDTFTKDTGLPGSALPPGPGYVLDPNGKIVVGTSTYYPSTTGGNLDLFSRTGAVETPPAVGRSGGEPMYSVSQHKWTTSPVVETPAQQPTEPTPYSVMDQRFTTLKNRFFEQAKRLRDSGLSPEQHNKILAEMQADYDNEKYKLSDVRTQLDGIQSAIKSGVVDPALGQQTQWEIVAPHMAAAMAPREPAVRAPMEPGTLNSQQKLMEGFVNAAEKQPGWFQPRAFGSLLKKYKAYRAESGYDQRPPNQQQQIDLRWDALMKGDSKNETWDPTDPHVKALRNYGGSRLMNEVNNKINGKQITPFADGINTPVETTDSRIGTIVTKGGKRWKIVNIDADGEPLVEAVR